MRAREALLIALRLPVLQVSNVSMVVLPLLSGAGMRKAYKKISIYFWWQSNVLIGLSITSNLQRTE